MQQKVAEGMDDLVPQRVWDNKHAAIDHSPCGSRGNGLDMADTAADPTEKVCASYGCGGCGERCVSRWSHRAAYELSKVVDVSQAKVIRLIFRVLCGLENRSDVRGAQPGRYSHLIE